METARMQTCSLMRCSHQRYHLTPCCPGSLTIRLSQWIARTALRPKAMPPQTVAAGEVEPGVVRQKDSVMQAIHSEIVQGKATQGDRETQAVHNAQPVIADMGKDPSADERMSKQALAHVAYGVRRQLPPALRADDAQSSRRGQAKEEQQKPPQERDGSAGSRKRSSNARAPTLKARPGPEMRSPH